MPLDASAGYGKEPKQLLNLLLTEIRVTPETPTLHGSKGVLDQAVSDMKPGTPGEVPSVVTNWRAKGDESGHWCETVSITAA